MSIGMLGQKIGMTQIFDERGDAIPVTLLKVGPCTITNINQENEYAKVQIGYEYANLNKLNKSIIGQFAKNKLPCFKYLKEYKTNNWDQLSIGKTLRVQEFKVGDYINVSGISIGKGFSGYHKRHHFSRGPMSHGSKNHRAPGSIGAGTTPGRVFPGKKMAGRMGNQKVTIKNLKILKIDLSNHVIVIKGCVPGKKGNIIYINQK